MAGKEYILFCLVCKEIVLFPQMKVCINAHQNQLIGRGDGYNSSPKYKPLIYYSRLSAIVTGSTKQKQGMKVNPGLFSQTDGQTLMRIAHGPGR